MRNEVILFRAKEEWNVLPTIKRRKANWIGHILGRNCLQTHVIKGKTEVTGRRRRRRKQLLDDLNEKRILKYQRESTRSHSVENYLSKEIRACPQAN